MPDGDVDAEASLAVENEDEPMSSGGEKMEKDPRKIARKYQVQLCKKALEENIIVYLETGCGKTHIAVLLIYELVHLIRRPQMKVCVFLAPTVALVHQQAKVIQDSIDIKVGIFCGSHRYLRSHRDWEKEIGQNEVFVMTPQILLHNLSHSYIKMDNIALLIFDECHHAQVKSSHPYAQIMKVFYKIDNGNLPRVFGMTASPVVGKGASSAVNLPKSINSLENLLDAKVYSVEDKIDLEQFVASPIVKIYPYGPVVNGTSSPYIIYLSKLEQFKRQCISELGNKIDVDLQRLQNLRSSKKVLRRIHDNMVFCLENLGLWGALQACHILLGDDYSERTASLEANEENGDYSVCYRYLSQAQSIFGADCIKDGAVSSLSCVEVLKEPFFSRKLLRLIGILSTFRFRPNMKCIIFVNRIVTARSLSYILQNLKILTWKCDFLVGVHSGTKCMSRKTMKSILEKFQNGKLNLLVATKVGEEGLDIQTCCLVIRFDLPETVASFIQSRGRARMPQSEYAFLVDSGNDKELDMIEIFRKGEQRVSKEISSRTTTESFDNPTERVYRVDATGASVTSGYSISLLHHYCAKLPHDEYFDPKPEFFYFDDMGGTICNITLPSNAPIRQIASSAQPSNEAAKKDACLKAIEELHKLGALNDFLLPYEEDMDEDDGVAVVGLVDPNSHEVEGSRGELHEMLVPAILKESWADSGDSIFLHAYYIDFCPVPDDRTYRKFGLFIKAPLPPDAERMELDLNLARGRHVMTKLFQMGLSEFNNDEILKAQNFQEMFLKVVLDRSEFVHPFVPLGTIAFYKSSSTFYLLLPIILHCDSKRLTVDWDTIKRCLSSPLFLTPVHGLDKEVPLDAYLTLANGCRSISDIENSLIYMPHKKTFYFTTNVVLEKNAYSPMKGSSDRTYVEHLTTTFGIQLKYPKQPLLRAKPLFLLHNLLHNRNHGDSESQELDEYFDDVAPELCELKIIGFSKDIGGSISLLPSLMHRLENLLAAIELKCMLSASFPEGSEVTASRVLEAITTEKCQECLSLERLEILGDSFLKFAVSRSLFLSHDSIDEGELTRRRSSAVKNSNLLKLAIKNNLQVYIRDQPFDPCQFFALGRPCPRICTNDSETSIHSHCSGGAFDEIRCSKGHHWLYQKTIADVVESLVGAFIVDSGFKAATSFVKWLGINVDYEASQAIHLCQASSRYLPLVPSMDVVTLENLLEYSFVHRGLLLQAFVHPSYNKHGGCYQRLEFLGDAVLDFLITSYVFSVYPKLKPGHLTDLRSALVNNRIFADVAAERSFNKFLICDSRSLSDDIKNYVEFIKLPLSERGLLQGPKCPKALGDLVESCMGAVILDSGFNLKLAWKIMLSFLDPITEFSNLQLNPIRELQELCQSTEWDLKFDTSKKGKNYLVEAKLSRKDADVFASAININKKEAHRIAAEQICHKLKDKGYVPKFNYLEKLLRSSKKMEAVLIGYNETPTNTIGLENLNIEELPTFDFEPKIYSVSKMFKQPSSPKFSAKQTSKTATDPSLDMQNPGRSQCLSAKSRLYEICAANCWKPPTFECCHEGGPGHMMFFVFKVLVETETPDMILECYSTTETKKKTAAEKAAEAALWYLQQKGY